MQRPCHDFPNHVHGVRGDLCFQTFHSAVDVEMQVEGASQPKHRTPRVTICELALPFADADDGSAISMHTKRHRTTRTICSPSHRVSPKYGAMLSFFPDSLDCAGTSQDLLHKRFTVLVIHTSEQHMRQNHDLISLKQVACERFVLLQWHVERRNRSQEGHRIVRIDSAWQFACICRGYPTQPFD